MAHTVQCSHPAGWAKFVARNGEMFENRIKAKEPANLKSKILHVDNSYNAYYKFMVNEIKLGMH